MGLWQSDFGDETPKPQPPAPVDPDRVPSTSASYYETRDNDIIGLLAVKGLGVLVFRATTDYRSDSGKLTFEGVSTFTNAEIGLWE